MSFPRYRAYKDSGVAWLGEVPAHWDAKRVKQLTSRISSGKTPLGGSETYIDEGVTFLRSQNVYDEGLRLEDVVFISEDVDAAMAVSRVRPSDILLNITGASIGRSCVVPDEFPPANVNQHVCVVRLKEKSQIPFVGWFFKSASAKNQIDLAQNGAAREGLNFDQIGRMALALAPLREQVAIAAFLDRETTKIDALVAEQQKLMTLLKEKRQAVISHAVTKGFDPTVPMKDSGVEWLGAVPGHWRVMPIRKAARLESGHTPSRSRPDWWQDCTVPWFTLADVWQIRDGGADVVHETKELVSEIGLANSSARLLPRGTVMLSRTASVGFSAIMGVDMATTQDFANWVCGNELRPEFLLMVLRSMKAEFHRLMMGSTHNTIYMPDIQALRFVLPPVADQAAIVAYIRKETVQFDTLIAEASTVIDLLTERRTALISAAVTGQIDVRNLATMVA